MDITAVGFIDKIRPLDTAAQSSPVQPGAMFEDIFRNAVSAVNETDAKVKTDEIAVATGKSDDLHSLMIDISKADLAVQTLVQLRNKALDAYNEIMKVTL